MNFYQMVIIVLQVVIFIKLIQIQERMDNK